MRSIAKKKTVCPIAGQCYFAYSWSRCKTKTYNNIVLFIQSILVTGKSSSQQNVPDIEINCDGITNLFRSDVIENSIGLVRGYDEFTYRIPAQFYILNAIHRSELYAQRFT